MAVAKRSWTAALFTAGAIAVVAVGAAMLWGTDRGTVQSVRLRPDDAAVTALGRKVYAAQCAACHGARLEGQPNWRERGPDGRLPAPPHDASGHTWHHSDELLFRITKLGMARAAKLASFESSMPAYEGVLTDAEILAVLSWIKAQWPLGIRAKHDEMSRGSSPQR